MRRGEREWEERGKEGLGRGHTLWASEIRKCQAAWTEVNFCAVHGISYQATARKLLLTVGAVKIGDISSVALDK